MVRESGRAFSAAAVSRRVQIRKTASEGREEGCRKPKT